QYYGLAYNENDGTFWYSRPGQPATDPPLPPGTTLYHIDGSGNKLGSYGVQDYFITGLAFDADNNHLWCIAQGAPDMLIEYAVSTGELVRIQGPFQVPWSSSENGAAGLDYDEEKNALVAIDKNTNDLMYFCDTNPNYSGPPGPGEPGVSPINSCTLSYTPWGVALAQSTETIFIASSSGPPFPLDEYASLNGCPRRRAIPLPVRNVSEDESGGLQCSSHPNPFNPVSEISYVLPSACHVKVLVFNLLGQRVTTLVDGYQAAGHNTVIWDGTDNENNKVASGVYFYRIKAGDLTETRKMILMK
ncbi:MAG TPA: FlgD immunoglobulin-like domain containing protein, partial [candidate division Zixibacteria bacterium]